MESRVSSHQYYVFVPVCRWCPKGCQYFAKIYNLAPVKLEFGSSKRKFGSKIFNLAPKF